MPITNLHQASDVYIKIALANLKSSFNTSFSWITPTNRYLPDPISQIKLDKNSPTGFNNSDLTDYIATSVFIHCYNGWSYLSTALHSFLEGDFSNCIHNAYYAELRAILSFLAAQGIGVFNSNNILIDNSGIARPIVCTINKENPTHAFTKLALQQWLEEPSNSEKVLRIITANGVSLKDWIDGTQFAPGSVLPSLLAKNWLAEWSFDMSIVQNDHDLRNVVSYHPQVFNVSYHKSIDSIKQRIEFLKQLWAICSPSEIYNNTLLRLSLENIYRQLGYRIDQLHVERDLKTLFQDVGLNGNSPQSLQLIKFLRREEHSHENDVFTKAKLPIPHPLSEVDIDPLGIISRACLFLIFSTKCADTLLKSTVTSKTELNFWLEYIGTKMGFWEIGGTPTLFSDLWEDVKIEIEELEKWSTNNGISHNQFLFKRDLALYTKYVKQINRAYLWTLNL